MPVCSHCGKEVSEGIKFCPECGERLKKGFTSEEREKYIQELQASVKEEKPAEKQKSTKKQLAGGIAVLVVAAIIIIAAVAICTPPRTPSLTASEQNYATIMAEHSSSLGEAMSNLGVLMENPQIGDDEWTIDVAIEITVIRLLYEEVQEMEPPSSMADIHYNYVQAMWHYNRAMDFLVEGIDTVNTDLIDQATSEILTGAEYIDEAAEQIENFVAAPSKSAETCTLTTVASPSGAGYVSPSGGEYEPGDQITLTASPASGYTFDHWSGSASGTSPTIVITMHSDKDITAYFEEEPPATFNPITITGTSDKASPPFEVTTEEWIIDWSYIPDYEYPEYAGFGFYVYPRGETVMYVESVLSGSTSGSTYSYAGPGEYYVEVLAANLKSWTIIISPA